MTPVRLSGPKMRDRRDANARNYSKSKAKNQYMSVARKLKLFSETAILASKLRFQRKLDTRRLRETEFPPRPNSSKTIHRILTASSEAVLPPRFMEAGCAVCGRLTPLAELTSLVDFEGTLDHLQGKIPNDALANHNWVGIVPPQLQGLTYAEGVMIARIRHNRCVIRVNSGRVRMHANAIMFAQPALKVYLKLPPSRDEISEILAFIFTGSSAPTQEDFDRTPMLVRRHKVAEALEWLKLNHQDYADLEISQENLMSYAYHDIPVAVDYRHTEGEPNDSIPGEARSVFDKNKEHGTTDGECSFAVHGLTGAEYSTAPMSQIKAVALQHLTQKGDMLAIGRNDIPESMYRNVKAYPGMFPWLFPYGKGGIGHPAHKSKLSDMTRKRNLLLYHDKRFQTDMYFPMLKGSSKGSNIIVKRSKLLATNPEVAANIADRMVGGEHVKPVTDAEKQCFALLGDLDGVGAHHQRNEIWSTSAFMAAPTWFITLSWADINHPIALYYAQEDTVYRPELKTSKERNLLISKNPVFLKEILGWESELPGLYGHTNGYYATVEQQGRLTLHLHLLLWIKNALTPQEIHSIFQKRLFEYLESAHQGDFMQGSMAEATPEEEDLQSGPHYKVPTQTLPSVPPPLCDSIHHDSNDSCDQCQRLAKWWLQYDHEVDDLLLRSNTGICKARFPREIFETTHVGEDGHINIRKQEAQLNTFSRVLTYFSRSNTDVTSLLSGTAVKAVVSYVSDYVSKLGLKSYQAFASVFDVFERNSETLSTGGEGTEIARTLMRQMINSMSTKMEIGSPMASIHQYVNFAWRSYVTFVKNFWYKTTSNEEEDEDIGDDLLTIQNQNGSYVACSIVDDYRFRPLEYEGINLYEWVQCSEKKARTLSFPISLMMISLPRSLCITMMVRHAFLPDHKSAFKTHTVVCDFRKLEKIIPNFIGGAVPRSDKGDREYYCMTVMTLFKPWRTPADLKDRDSNWDQIFHEHTFTSRQQELIRNFNIRYECNDARDDHYAIMRRKMAERGEYTSKSILGQHDKFANDIEAGEFGDEDMGCDDDITIGRRTEILNMSRESIRQVLEMAKWLDQPRDGLLDIDTTPFNAPYKARRTWAEIVKSERKLYTANKLSDMPASENSHGTYVPNKVEVVPHDFLNPTPRLTKEANNALINDICNKPGMELNREQERAFRIVADHASSPQPTPLKMYIGGMGGSGKSAVFNAVIEFFVARKEAYRFVVVGPTGSTAALLNGSTYHSVFRIQRDRKTKNREDLDGIPNDAASVAAINERLQGVEYILLDEISMVACEDLQTLASQAAKARSD
ncbi:hypothetical protein C8R43DRAFT_1090749 [Mycena crocata]|nr:hypothetical protein C8R43DRAFT_1090749 [Mycena crocata]